MPKEYRIVGLPAGAVDTMKHEIKFDLATSEGRALSCIAKYGPASQVISGLARMREQLRLVLHGAKGMEIVPAEKVAATHIQKEQWTDTVLMQLTTPEGVPYTFAFPCRIASDIADQLKIESAKPTHTGRT